ncbi:O-antigen ligase family protein [Microvirga antarctica]|uniref:O-antigen ligase family protein n=1 Tax=Microvirga antarctica TaxID=2819233 RepID=UPI001B30DD81|nr:O-antigen ligase family protein [Microvirga antarctica]
MRLDKENAALLCTLPVVIAIGWLCAVVAAADMGPAMYAAPAVGSLTAIALFILLRSSVRGRLTTQVLLVTAVFVLSLNFRQRELGETGLDWQNGMKFAVWLAILALGALRWRELAGLVGRPLIGLSVAGAAVALASAAWSDVPTYTAASAVGLFAYLVLACLVVRDLDEASILRTLVFGLAAFLALGLLAGALQFEVAWLEPSAEETVRRLQGFSGHPNTFGQQAAIFITLTAIAYRSRILRPRIVALLLALGLAAILSSGSRTNLAAAAVAWLVIAVRAHRWRRAIVLTGLIGLSTILFLAASDGLVEMDGLLRGLSRTGSEGEIFTLTGRTELWSTAWSLITERPLFGWGYNGVEERLAESVSSSFEGTAVNVHNMLLQSILSLGFLGSLPAIAAIGILCTRFFTRPDPVRDQIALLLLIIGLGEVGMAATPILLTVVVFYVFVRDEVSCGQSCAWGPGGIA